MEIIHFLLLPTPYLYWFPLFPRDQMQSEDGIVDERLSNNIIHFMTKQCHNHVIYAHDSKKS